MVSGEACPLCQGRCRESDLRAWTVPDLTWFWEAIATAADRRGDPVMAAGSRVAVVVPTDGGRRAAAVGFFTGRELTAGQSRRLDLAHVQAVIGARAPGMTPGDVAAHAVGRRLAVRARAVVDRRAAIGDIRTTVVNAFDADDVLRGDGPRAVAYLQGTGWLGRLVREPDPEGLVREAAQVLGQVRRIPEGDRRDRRLLVPGRPHALDEGERLAGLTLALLAGIGAASVPSGAAARASWAQVGVDCDELQGGLTTLGITLEGWTVPLGSTCTLPPRELYGCRWPPPPEPGAWVRVTENPSILAAAADVVARDPRRGSVVRLVCTMGTPSALEIAALGGLTARGWRVGVRADFDAAGLRHVAALLAGIPGSVPWRMGADDYHAALPGATVAAGRRTAPPSSLVTTAELNGRWAFEEALLPALLDDLRQAPETDQQT